MNDQELLAQLKQALIDLVDGQDKIDLSYSTGLEEERCQEIIDLFKLVCKND